MKMPLGARFAAVALVAVGSVVWSTPTYGATQVDTTRTMLQLSAKAANEKARRDLLSVLQPTGKFTRGNRIRVRGITMDTIPYGAGFKGLCRKDELSLIYGSTVKGPNNVNDPLRPVGVDAKSLFHVLNGPVADLADGFSTQASWKDGDCNKLQSNKKTRWFSAADAREAARGANVLFAAIEAVRSGQLKVDCNPRHFATTCEDKARQVGQIENIVSVSSDCSVAILQQCYRLMTTEAIELTVVASFEDDQSARPVSIVSVSATQYIIVT